MREVNYIHRSGLPQEHSIVPVRFDLNRPLGRAWSFYLAFLSATESSVPLLEAICTITLRTVGANIKKKVQETKKKKNKKKQNKKKKKKERESSPTVAG